MERRPNSVPPTYAPSLVISHGKSFRSQTFCTLSDGCYHVKSIPEMRNMWCVAASFGWLMLKHFYSSQCWLFDPISLTKIHLPPFEATFDEGVLTHSPEDPNCIVLVLSNVKRSCLFCQIGDEKWKEQKLENINEKNRIPIKGYIRPVSCQGIIHLFSKNRMAILNVHDTFSPRKIYAIEDPVSTPGGCTSSCLVESCGEIFKVIEIHFGCLFNVTARFDVFKLDLSIMAWVKVESLGDRIFLLGYNPTSISATDLDVKGNCIYLNRERYTSWERYDMDDGTSTLTLPCPKKFPHWHGPYWVVPNPKLQVKKELARVEEPKDEVNDKIGLKDLPSELFDMILSSFLLDDWIRFRLTCKLWMSMTPPIRSNHLLMHSKPESNQLPWLMSFPKDNKGVCTFHHPVYGDTYTGDFPELSGAVIRSAKFGWLLMSRGASFHFLNPFTMEKITVPDAGVDSCRFLGVSFSAPPTSSEFVVFGHTALSLSLYRKGKDTWHEYFCDVPWDIMDYPCNPVFCDGVFYCLGKDGMLAVFNPEETDEEHHWSVLQVPKVSSSTYSDLPRHFHSFIVEYEAEIVSVFVGSRGYPICMFKFDRSKMKWSTLNNLDDKMLFLSHTSSTLLPAKLKGTENRIYFPRFHGNESVFYSLSTKSYRCFGSNHSRQDWTNTCEHLHCTWIQSG